MCDSGVRFRCAIPVHAFHCGSGRWVTVCDRDPFGRGHSDHEHLHTPSDGPAHWGYMISGDLAVTYNDGSDETYTTGDVLSWQPGHSVRVNADAELILFSPQVEHGHVLDHILAKMASN